jgi:hypothetical protein
MYQNEAIATSVKGTRIGTLALLKIGSAAALAAFAAYADPKDCSQAPRANDELIPTRSQTISVALSLYKRLGIGGIFE